MKTPYLIQRGTFKKTSLKEINGIDSLVSWDYMGSSEFEWGALPKSLRQIMRNNVNYVFEKVKVKTQDGQKNYVFVYAPKNDIDDVVFWIGELAAKQHHHTKEHVALYDVINQTAEHRCYTDTNFWWDIENHWFAFLGTENQKKVKKAILKNIERNVPDIS